MSIHYLLDGYNVIHQMPSALNQAKLEDQRSHLVRFIEHQRPQGSLNNPVTIVFDGSEEVFGGMNSPVVKIIFSQGESADDKIKKMIAQAGNAKDMVVVTDDRDIQYAVRALGAKVVGSRSFLDRAKVSGKKNKNAGAGPRRGKNPVKTDTPGPGKYIPKVDESKITSELSRIWLDPKRKRK